MNMRNLRIVLLLLATTGVSVYEPTPSRAQSPALIVLVRHGDTVPNSGSDPDLTAAGAKRAQDLASALSGTKFTAIITTQLVRTKQTAQPTATALGLTPEVVAYAAPQREAHVKSVADAVRKHAGGSVLVVGHSTTIPLIIGALGGPRLSDICETIFDNLFALVPAGANVQFVHARYGAASSAGPDCK
jgi:broad specificity phosphatase PhoE